jgi:hypothetical protein
MLSELVWTKSEEVPNINGNFAHIADLIKFYMMRKAIPIQSGMDKENKLGDCFGDVKGKLFCFLWGINKN